MCSWAKVCLDCFPSFDRRLAEQSTDGCIGQQSLLQLAFIPLPHVQASLLPVRAAPDKFRRAGAAGAYGPGAGAGAACEDEGAPFTIKVNTTGDWKKCICQS